MVSSIIQLVKANSHSDTLSGSCLTGNVDARLDDYALADGDETTNAEHHDLQNGVGQLDIGN